MAGTSTGIGFGSPFDVQPAMIEWGGGRNRAWALRSLGSAQVRYWHYRIHAEFASLADFYQKAFGWKRSDDLSIDDCSVTRFSIIRRHANSVFGTW